MNSKQRRRSKRQLDGSHPGSHPGRQNERNTTKWMNNLLTVTFWTWAAAEEYADRLAAILGPDSGVHTSETFCQRHGCNAEEMQTWLTQEWVRHDIQKVSRGEEKLDCFR